MKSLWKATFYNRKALFDWVGWGHADRVNSGPCNLDQTCFKCRESSQITSAYLSGIASAAAKDIKKWVRPAANSDLNLFRVEETLHFISYPRELKSHTGVKKRPNCILIKKMGSTEKQKRWRNRISWTHDLFWVSTCRNFSSLEPSCEGLSLLALKKKKNCKANQFGTKRHKKPTNCPKPFSKNCSIMFSNKILFQMEKMSSLLSPGQSPRSGRISNVSSRSFATSTSPTVSLLGQNPEMPLDVGCKQLQN